MVINKDISVFVNSNKIDQTFDFAKEICLDVPPFGIAEITPKNTSRDDLITKNESKNINFESLFETSYAMRCYIFVAPSTAMQFFHQWQRQRRTWWRQFSASPGRYILTDIKPNSENQTQNVEITAKYPFGDQLLEKLTLNYPCKSISSSQLQIKDGRKMTEAQCVVSEICLSTMLLNAVCDAYDEPVFQGNPREILRLHRKLTPYKLSFSITAQQKSAADELKDLALYICRQLRNNHVSCFWTPIGYKNTLESQWNQYDQMGIPYNVLLNEATLRNGIAQLRSRDTTLKEQIHVTNLPNYVEQLFKNY